jgi:ribosomal protein L18
MDAEAWPLDRQVPLLFWMLRHKIDDMAVVITEADIAAMEQSMTHNEQTPALVVHATARHLIMRLADARTGDMILISENNDADYDRAKTQREVRRARENAGTLVSNAMAELNQGMVSNGVITDLCNALLLLAKS